MLQEIASLYFSCQLFVASFAGTYVFAKKVPKRNFFYWKFTLGGLVCSIVTTVLWFLSKRYGGDQRSLYVTLCSFFALIELFIVFYISYKNSVVECLTYIMAGWTILHLSGKIQYFICLLFNVTVDYFNYSWQYTLINFLSLTFTFIVITLILKYFYSGDTRVKNPKVILPLAIIVLVSVILNSFSPYDNSVISQIFLNLYALAFCIISLYFIFWSFDNSYLSNRVKLVEELDKKKAKQYEMSKESINIINNRTHDLKKLMSRFGENAALLNEDEIKTLNKHIEYYDKRSKTGIQSLDTIITEKIYVFEKKKIKFRYKVEAQGLEIFSDFEIYTLFGNILDNAEEALSTCEEKDRFDELKVYKNENLLIIHNENYTKDTVRIVNNKLFTSKKDTISHGYGTESIKETVKKYKGVCTFSCANNIFSVDILIPLENKKQ